LLFFQANFKREKWSVDNYVDNVWITSI